ncbi:hypothetical protein, partial [Nocardia wallacei]|uniref:hypothetical protein n=1 Tax=Nocardia wallacei TaxID=480035 RepID=UPI0024555506
MKTVRVQRNSRRCPDVEIADSGGDANLCALGEGAAKESWLRGEGGGGGGGGGGGRGPPAAGGARGAG